MQNFISRQFILFLLTGGTAAAINFYSRIVYNQWMNFSTAIIMAYITGMITAFILARAFVFKNSNQQIHNSALIFTLVNLIAVLQTWGISMLLVYSIFPLLGITFFQYEIAHAVGIMIPVFTSYWGHKRWTFRTAAQ